MKESIRILLAQSKKSNTEFLSSILKKAEYHEIFFASDGIDTLRFFEESAPDVIFMDSELPFPGGISVLKKIKKADPDCIVAVTVPAYSKTEANDFIESGADGLITEPLSEDRIIPWLVVSLATKERHRELTEEYHYINTLFNDRLDYERVVGKFASEGSVSFEEAEKQIAAISESKNIPLEKLIQMLK